MDQERPRPVLFHWVANMVFAGVALMGGVLFGERVPPETLRLLPVMVPVIGLLLLPITRRWERLGMEKRKAQARTKGDPSAPGKPKAGPTPRQRRSR